MKRAIIIGSFGQDGSLLYEFLSKKKYSLLGIGRNRVQSNVPSLKTKGVNITQEQDVNDMISTFLPDEVYHLAAFHHSSEDIMENEIQLFKQSFEINVLSLITHLEAIRKFSPKTKLFYAASSLVFKNNKEEEQSETTKYEPACMYGITKASGLHLCQYYRDKHSIFAASGILYNHESTLRRPGFLSKKIIQTVVAIKNKEQKKLIIGDINAEVDWGYAPDYIEAMHGILQAKTPDDYIISSGTVHSVKDFIQVAFDYLGLDWTQHVEENPDLLHRKGAKLRGNNQKLKTVTGWNPKHTFEEFIQEMIKEEMRMYESK